MHMIVDNIEVFLRYGPIGVLALYIILDYFKSRAQMRLEVDHIAVMKELSFLLQELMHRLGNLEAKTSNEDKK